MPRRLACVRKRVKVPLTKVWMPLLLMGFAHNPLDVIASADSFNTQ
jgi:hypothetical protein